MKVASRRDGRLRHRARARLVEAGYEVVIGSRDAERARAAAAELGVDGATNGRCQCCDLVVIATKAEATLDTAAELRGDRHDARALGRGGARVHAQRRRAHHRGDVDRRSTSGDSRRPPAVHSLAARNLGADEAPDEDVLVCGDDADAKAIVLELAERITAGRAIDCGPLASARALEGLTAVIVNVNKRYKAHVGVRITGVA